MYKVFDSIDIQCEILPVPFEGISKQADREPSEKIRERVIKACKIQEERFCRYTATEPLIEVTGRKNK